MVNYTLTGRGLAALGQGGRRTTSTSYVAIELDGVVQSAPIIQPTQSTFTSFGGQGEISGGNMTETQAKSLALAMQFGSLPVRLHQLTTQTVSPTLGKSSLKAGLVAGLAGLILVLVYVIVYYRMLGLVVVSGLAVTAAPVVGHHLGARATPRSPRASTWPGSPGSSCPSASPSTRTSSTSNG